MDEAGLSAAPSASCTLGASGLDATSEPRAVQLSDELAQLEAELREMEARLGVQVPASPAEGVEPEAAEAVASVHREGASLDLVCDEREEEQDGNEKDEEEPAGDATEATAELDFMVDPELEALLLRYRGPESSSAGTPAKPAEPTTGRAALAMLGEREAELEREVQQLQQELAGGDASSSERLGMRPPRLETIQEEATNVTWDYTPQSVAARDMSLHEEHEEELRRGLDDSTSALALDLAALDVDAEEDPSASEELTSNAMPKSDCTSAIVEEEVLKCPFAGLSSPPPLPPFPAESMSPCYMFCSAQTPVGQEVLDGRDAEAPESKASGLSLDLVQHGVLDTLDVQECAVYLTPHPRQNPLLDEADKDAGVASPESLDSGLGMEEGAAASDVEECSGQLSPHSSPDAALDAPGARLPGSAAQPLEVHRPPALDALDSVSVAGSTSPGEALKSCLAQDLVQYGVLDTLDVEECATHLSPHLFSSTSLDVPDAAEFENAAQLAEAHCVPELGALDALSSDETRSPIRSQESRLSPDLAQHGILDTHVSSLLVQYGVLDTLDVEECAVHLSPNPLTAGVRDAMYLEDNADIVQRSSDVAQHFNGDLPSGVSSEAFETPAKVEEHLSSPFLEPHGVLDTLEQESCSACIFPDPEQDVLEHTTVDTRGGASVGPADAAEMYGVGTEECAIGSEAKEAHFVFDVEQHGVLHTWDEETCAARCFPHSVQNVLPEDTKVDTQKDVAIYGVCTDELATVVESKEAHICLSVVQHRVTDIMDEQACVSCDSPQPVQQMLLEQTTVDIQYGASVGRQEDVERAELGTDDHATAFESEEADIFLDDAQHGVLDIMGEACSACHSPQPVQHALPEHTRVCIQKGLNGDRQEEVDMDGVGTEEHATALESEEAQISLDDAQHDVLDTMDGEACSACLSPQPLQHTLLEQITVDIQKRAYMGEQKDVDMDGVGAEEHATAFESEETRSFLDDAQHGVLDTMDEETCAACHSLQSVQQTLPEQITVDIQNRSAGQQEDVELDGVGTDHHATALESEEEQSLLDDAQPGVLNIMDEKPCGACHSPQPVHQMLLEQMTVDIQYGASVGRQDDAGKAGVGTDDHATALESEEAEFFLDDAHGVLDTMDEETCAACPSPQPVQQTPREHITTVDTMIGTGRSQQEAAEMDKVGSGEHATTLESEEARIFFDDAQHDVLDTINEEACSACQSLQPVQHMLPEHITVDIQNGTSVGRQEDADMHGAGTEEHAIAPESKESHIFPCVVQHSVLNALDVEGLTAISSPHPVQSRIIDTVESDEANFSDFEEEEAFGSAADPHPRERNMQTDVATADAATPQLGELLSRFQMPVKVNSSPSNSLPSFEQESVKYVEHAPLSSLPCASPCEGSRSAPVATFDLNAATPSVQSADCNETASMAVSAHGTVQEPAEDLHISSDGTAPLVFDDGEEICQTCRTRYLADSRFCRMCGQKRDFPSKSSVQRPSEEPRPFESVPCVGQSVGGKKGCHSGLHNEPSDMFKQTAASNPTPSSSAARQSASRTAEVRPHHHRGGDFLKNVFALNAEEPVAMSTPGEAQGIHRIFSVSSTSAKSSNMILEHAPNIDSAPQCYERYPQPEENSIEQGHGLYGNVHHQYDEQRRQKKREKQEKQERLKREEKLKKQERLARLGVAPPLSRAGLREKIPAAYPAHSLGRSTVPQDAMESMADKHGIIRHTASSASKVTLPPLLGQKTCEDMVPEEEEGAVAFQGVRVKLPKMPQPASKRDRSAELPTRSMQQSRGAASTSSAPSLGRQRAGRSSNSYRSSKLLTIESLEKQKARLASKMELLSVFHTYHNKVENMSADQLQSLLKQLHGGRDAEESPSHGMKVQRRLRQIDKVCNGLF